MLTYASDVVIASTRADVWPYLVERDKQAQWTDVPMEPLTEGPMRVGSQMRLKFGMGPVGASITLEITALDVNERMAWTTISKGGIQWQGVYLLAEATGSGTRLSQQGTLSFGGLWRLAAPMVGAEIKRNEIKELEKLKGILERSTVPQI